MLCVMGRKTVLGFSTKAASALPTHGTPIQYDKIAFGEVSDTGTDLGNDARSFMPEQERKIVIDGTLSIVKIGVANATGLNVDNNFTWPGIRNVNCFNRNGFALCFGHDSAHVMWHCYTPLPRV